MAQFRYQTLNCQDAPDPRCAHVACVVQDTKMLIFGGFDSHRRASNETWLLDLRLQGPPPLPRAHRRGQCSCWLRCEARYRLRMRLELRYSRSDHLRASHCALSSDRPLDARPRPQPGNGAASALLCSAIAVCIVVVGAGRTPVGGLTRVRPRRPGPLL